ncbi:Alpha/Beta hydrolase protein [Podospora conica]|nr:Alpha/Beta hydrolase protein [Schizothecium conicum]
MMVPHLAALLLAAATSTSAQTLPVIDLGTTVHRALNLGSDYFSFKNIPYAEPPVGPLRFRHPIPLLSINRTINDGTAPRSCYQQGSPWFQYSVPLVIQKLIDGGVVLPPPGPVTGPPPGQSEDCLVLDVTVPKAIYTAAAAGTLTKPVPVVVWIHGGGFIEGSKDSPSPSGLLAAAGAPGIIHVAINYRLGLFGFPPRSPNLLDLTASNAGLHDQRLALTWVRHTIRRFGGDPNRVTLLGESAGAGAIVAQLTAFGGIDGTSPFQRAILQSPYLAPAAPTATYANLLTTANVTSYTQARALSSSQLAAVNAAMINAGPFSSTVFAPNIDGLGGIVPAHPMKLLRQGRVDRAVDVLVAHNADEGLIFTDPRIQGEAEFKAYLGGWVPPSLVDELASTVYPPDFSGAHGYTTQVDRTRLAVGEGFLDCVAYAVARGYGNGTRGYVFSKWPGIHAQDLDYTFYEGQTVGAFGMPVDGAVAAKMQGWVVDWIVKGDAPGSRALELPVYGAGANVVDVNGTAYAVVRDPAANARCKFWVDRLGA